MQVEPDFSKTPRCFITREHYAHLQVSTDLGSPSGLSGYRGLWRTSPDPGPAYLPVTLSLPPPVSRLLVVIFHHPRGGCSVNLKDLLIK